MTIALGKRKRRTQIEVADDKGHSHQPTDHDIHMQNLLRHHFETKFEPLDPFTTGFAKESPGIDGTERASPGIDWTGFSDEEEQSNTLVIDYQNTEMSKLDVPREELKLFMTAKPPSHSLSSSSTTHQIPSDAAVLEDVATDAVNLKKDLALQRLLEESHLLDATSSLTPSGQNRHKALDIRQQALGSRSSVFLQKNMPLAQRKGIMEKSAEKDANRRRQAKDNGIILEKIARSRSRDPKRQREIGAPTVGRFSRGMLTLSKKDVTDIVGRPRKSKRR